MFISACCLFCNVMLKCQLFFPPEAGSHSVTLEDLLCKHVNQASLKFRDLPQLMLP